MAANISEEQGQYLEVAQEAPPTYLYQVLERILQDSDIMSGRETLHPDWLPLFLARKDELSTVIPRKELSRIQDALSALGPQGDIRDIDPALSRLTFLLGAGASKPEPSGIPTVKELLPDLLERAKRLDREDLTRLADFCEKTRADNIEDLLTAVQIGEFSSRNPTILKFVEFLLFRRGAEEEFFPTRRQMRSAADLSVAFLQDTLQVLFGLLSSRMLPAKPNTGHKAIADYVKGQRGTAIVTTNYDCCMDLALGEVGKDFLYMLDFSNIPAPSQDTNSQTNLIKLHGSLNWFYCDTCQRVQLIDIGRMADDYALEKALYPVIGVCRDCGGQRRGLLVPPLALKFDVAPALNPLLDRAQEAFNSADVVVVVGFSFADADKYISRMLSKWMQAKAKANLVIFDPDDSVVQKVRRQFSLRIPNFEAQRIVPVIGDCAETLPKFLTGELQREQSAPKETARAKRKAVTTITK